MFGQYAAFIVPSYAISAVCMIGAALIIRSVYLARKRELAALEEEDAK